MSKTLLEGRRVVASRHRYNGSLHDYAVLERKHHLEISAEPIRKYYLAYRVTHKGHCFQCRTFPASRPALNRPQTQVKARGPTIYSGTLPEF